jgi:hypothetical protein
MLPDRSTYTRDIVLIISCALCMITRRANGLVSSLRRTASRSSSPVSSSKSLSATFVPFFRRAFLAGRFKDQQAYLLISYYYDNAGLTSG